MYAAARSDSWAMALRALRAHQWWYFALLPAARWSPGAPAGPFVLGAALAALLLAYAYGLNAQSDRATDLDARKNPLAAARLCPPQLPALLAALAAGALGLAALGGGVPVLVAAALSLLASTVYSVGPRLKTLPVTGTLLNAAIFAPLLACAPVATPPSLTLLALVFVAMLLQNQLLHERADADEDARGGARTTSQVLGERATRVCVVALGAAGAVGAAFCAGSRGAALVAGVLLGAVSTGALVAAGGAAAARARHRRLALAAGALLFLVTR